MASIVILSPSVMVIVLITSKCLLGSSGSAPTITSSSETRTALVMSFGWILA